MLYTDVSGALRTRKSDKHSSQEADQASNQISGIDVVESGITKALWGGPIFPTLHDSPPYDRGPEYGTLGLEVLALAFCGR